MITEEYKRILEEASILIRKIIIDFDAKYSKPNKEMPFKKLIIYENYNLFINDEISSKSLIAVLLINMNLQPFPHIDEMLGTYEMLFDFDERKIKFLKTITKLNPEKENVIYTRELKNVSENIDFELNKFLLEIKNYF
jgi:hypothetical protein